MKSTPIGTAYMVEEDDDTTTLYIALDDIKYASFLQKNLKMLVQPFDQPTYKVVE